MYGTNWNLLGLLGAVAAAGALTGGSVMAAAQKVPLPRPRPAIIAAKHPAPPAKAPVAAAARKVPQPQTRPPHRGLSAFPQANVGLRGSLFASRPPFTPMLRPSAGPFAIAPTPATSAADIAA